MMTCILMKNKISNHVLRVLRYGIDEKNEKSKNMANYINRNISSERHICSK